MKRIPLSGAVSLLTFATSGPTQERPDATSGEAVELYIRARHDIFLGLMCKLLRQWDRSYAEDCLQEAYITMFRKWGQLRLEGRRDSWASQVVYRHGLMFLRKNRTGMRGATQYYADLSIGVSEDDQKVIPRIDERLDAHKVVEFAKEHMPDVINYGQGCSLKKSFPNRKTLPSQKSYLSRCRATLRRRFGSAGGIRKTTRNSGRLAA